MKVRLKDADGELMTYNNQQEAIESMAEALGMDYEIGYGEWSGSAT